jgi:hypothetical protein
MVETAPTEELFATPRHPYDSVTRRGLMFVTDIPHRVTKWRCQDQIGELDDEITIIGQRNLLVVPLAFLAGLFVLTE